jgi:hypothetical protein
VTFSSSTAASFEYLWCMIGRTIVLISSDLPATGLYTEISPWGGANLGYEKRGGRKLNMRLGGGGGAYTVSASLSSP